MMTSVMDARFFPPEYLKKVKSATPDRDKFCLYETPHAALLVNRFSI